MKEKTSNDKNKSIEIYENLQITPEELGFLKELCNIGSGNAITALSNFLGKDVDIYVPKINFIDFRDIPGLLGKESHTIAAILQNIDEGLDAHTLFAIDKNTYNQFISIMMKKINLKPKKDSVHIKNAGELEKSIIKEITNILTGSYLNAIATLLDMPLNPSPPALSIDMAGAILSQLIYLYPSIPEKIMIIETDIFLDDKKINGSILLLPRKNALTKLIKKLKEVQDEAGK